MGAAKMFLQGPICVLGTQLSYVVNKNPRAENTNRFKIERWLITIFSTSRSFIQQKHEFLSVLGSFFSLLIRLNFRL